jgi:hypothetical protein
MGNALYERSAAGTEEAVSRLSTWSAPEPMGGGRRRVRPNEIAGRDGDIDDALAHGYRAFQAERWSMPHLIMVGEELRRVLDARYQATPTSPSSARGCET